MLMHYVPILFFSELKTPVKEKIQKCPRKNDLNAGGRVWTPGPRLALRIDCLVRVILPEVSALKEEGIFRQYLPGLHDGLGDVQPGRAKSYGLPLSFRTIEPR